MTNHGLKIKGMHCNSCKILITEALQDAGAKNVNISLDGKKQIGSVTFDSSLPKKELKKIIEGEGEYKVQ